MDYWSRLYEFRKQKAMSQEEVSTGLGVSRQSISLWETNQASPSMDNLIALAKLFKVSLDVLVGLDNISIKSNIHNDKPEYKITYEENKNTVYRRDYAYINTTNELLLLSITVFLYLMALLLMIRAPKLNLDVARIVMVISFSSIIVGTLIYPLHVYTNIKKKLSNKNQYKIQFYKSHLIYTISNAQEEMIDYKLINYYIDKKDYIVIYVIRGNRIYVPKHDILELDNFLSDRIERRTRKKPLDFYKM